jgi:hypothetical protein
MSLDVLASMGPSFAAPLAAVQMPPGIILPGADTKLGKSGKINQKRRIVVAVD